MKKVLVLILGLSMQTGFSQLTNGLQGCYPLDCDNAVNLAPTGPILNGMVSNVNCVPNRFGTPGSAYHFMGNTSSFIQLPGNPNLLKPQTISVSGWYRSDDLANAYLIYTRNSCSSNFEAYALNFLNGGGFYVSKASGTSCSRVQLFQDLNVHPAPGVGAWTHVVFCIDNSNVTLYINGSLNSTATHNIPWDYDATKDVILGNTNEFYTQSFHGAMDNLRFYDRCLTPHEVRILFRDDPACESREPIERSVGIMDLSSDNITGLSQNVPNPFSQETLVNYNVPVNVTNASIEVYNVVGQKIAEYPILNRGEASIKLSSADLNAGIYIYSLIGDGKVLDSKRMVVSEK